MSAERNPIHLNKQSSKDEPYRKYKDSYNSPEPKQKDTTQMPSTGYSRYEGHKEAGEIEGDATGAIGDKSGYSRQSSYTEDRHR